MNVLRMSTSEIIAELPRLGSEELVLVKNKVEEVMKSRSSLVAPPEGLSNFLLRVAGTAEGLPSDLAENHDHYLYGAPRRSRS
jgi:hypothetical protein